MLISHCIILTNKKLYCLLSFLFAEFLISQNYIFSSRNRNENFFSYKFYLLQPYLNTPDSGSLRGIRILKNKSFGKAKIFFGTSIVKDIVGRKILGRKYSHGGEYAFFGGQ
jgi:hypothetical protein